ncbi:MAG: sigma-70 family RNA polymerase sigma factor [Eubacterium sp.]|nr:sigma-70 family RNA polymerase sigma factor [Eubacterium sp.]
MDDIQIISLFFERSEQAIEELSAKYGTLMKSVALNILGNTEDAEESVNDALLAVWNTVPPEDPQSLSAYSCRITRNIALTKYQRNTAQKRNSHFDISLDELSECLAGKESVEGSAAAEELGRLINRFLAGQNRKNRQLFVRRYWFGENIRELADSFRMSENHVSVLLSRLRGKLRVCLEKEGFLNE